MFGAPFSPKRAACGAQRRPRRCGRQICRFFFSRSPSSPCAADPSAASAAIVTDLRCRRGKIHDSSFKKCFDGFAGNFWYSGLFRRLLLFFVLRQRDQPLSLAFARQFPRQRHALSGASRQLPQRGSHWRAGPLCTGRPRPDRAQKSGPRLRGQRLLDKSTSSSCCESRPQGTTVLGQRKLCSSRVSLTGTPVPLPMGEVAAKQTERARMLPEKHWHSDSIALTKSLLIAAQRL